MKTIEEIRARAEQHKERLEKLEILGKPTQEIFYPDSIMSGEAYEIAVTLLAEIERLDTDCDRYAGAWKHGQQEIDNLKSLVERRDESIDGWIKTLNSCNEELAVAKAEVDRLATDKAKYKARYHQLMHNLFPFTEDKRGRGIPEFIYESAKTTYDLFSEDDKDND